MSLSPGERQCLVKQVTDGKERKGLSSSSSYSTCLPECSRPTPPMSYSLQQGLLHLGSQKWGVGSPFPQLSADIPVGQLHFYHVLPRWRVVLTKQAIVCSFQFQTSRFPLMKKMGALIVLILCWQTACQLEELSSSKLESWPLDEGHDALEPQSSNVGNVGVILKAKTEAFVSDPPAFLVLPCDILYFTHFVPLGNLCGSHYSVVCLIGHYRLPASKSSQPETCVHMCRKAQ